MSRKNLEEFIDLYKSYPCLWQTKSKLYHDRPLREAAYKVLVEKLKEFEPDANKDLVVKKINNLRSSVRKEKKKYEASVKSGASSDDVYRPKLWYYDMMNFLNDQDTPRESTSNLDTQDESISEIGIDENLENEVEGIDSVNSTVERSDIVNPPRAEKSKKNDAKLTTEVLVSVRDHFKRPKIEEDRFDVISKGFAMRLRELEKRQRIIAEKLINDILFEAEMGSLTLNHKFTTAAETTSSFYSRNHSSNSNFSTNSNLSSNSSFSENGVYVYQENDDFAGNTTNQHQTQPENAACYITNFMNSLEN
ncbi:uncharacterized protein LOC132927255 [Rhopalosiphum padi]|uniref:uncharacterized protein LOC132927255 n=1 Tax=Rhopalosiphum padi TaxID=40932 RepID=UPI00298DAB12|nr:uncharacterized protein LOC132927255 [Rhopalosiphum padi]